MSTTVAFLDRNGETDLSSLPVGTLIITVGPTEQVTHEDRQYMKCQRDWMSPDGGHWDDESLPKKNRQRCPGAYRTVEQIVLSRPW